MRSKILVQTLCLILTVQTVKVYAQNGAPNKVSLQSVIRNGSGNLQVNTSIGVRLSIVKGSQFGPSVYVETHNQKTNSNGLLSLFLGDGTAVVGNFANIPWQEGPYMLKTEYDLNGGTNYMVSGYTDVVSVPYSIYSTKSDSSNNAKSASSVNCIGCITIENLNTKGLEPFLKDTSSTNEIQVLSISNDTIFLKNGGFVKLPKDFDRDSLNEIQKLSKSGDTLILSKSNLIVLGDEDPINEIQTLKKVKDTVFLTNGGFIKLTDDDSLNEIQSFKISHDTLKLTKSNKYVILGNKEQDTINGVVTQLGDQVYSGSYNMNSTTTVPNFQTWINLSCNLDLGANTYILGIQGATPFGIMNFNNSSGTLSLYRNMNSNLKKYQLGMDQFNYADKVDTTFSWFSGGVFTVYKPKNDTYYNLPTGGNTSAFFNKMTISTSPTSSQNQLMAFAKRGDTLLIVFQKGDQSDFYYYFYQYVISKDKLFPLDSVELTLRNGTKCTTANVILNSIYGAIVWGDFKAAGITSKFQLSAGVFKNFRKKETKLLNIPPYPTVYAYFSTDKNYIFWNSSVVYTINANHGLLKFLGDSKPIISLAQSSIFVSTSTSKNIGNLIKSNGKYYLIGYMFNPGTGNENGYLYSLKVE